MNTKTLSNRKDVERKKCIGKLPEINCAQEQSPLVMI